MKTSILDVFLLLLLVAVIIAVAFARDRQRRSRARRRLLRTMRRSLEGLGFLLNDETDRALDVFLSLAELEPEAHEVQFALAHLFRRKGELERSIRIHQSFIARPDLPRSVHVRALYELACDYLSAGLHDRAESLLKDIAGDPTHGVRALRRLLTIYEYQHDWDGAYETALRLARASDENLDPLLAHYRCEAADRALALGYEHEAVRLYREALARDVRSIRAHAALGRIAQRRGDDRGALVHFERALWSDVHQAFRTYADCYLTLRRLEDRRGLVQLLERLEQEDLAGREAVALTALVDPRIDVDHARHWLPLFLAAHPSFRANLLLLGVIPPDGEEEGLAEDLPARLRPLLVHALRFRCLHCGYSLHQDAWQCPSCRSWSALVPHLDWSSEEPHERTALPADPPRPGGAVHPSSASFVSLPPVPHFHG